MECELNDKTCKPHTVWMFFSWLEVCDILNLKKKEPLSIHKTEIIPINLCSNSCFRGNMCTVIVIKKIERKKPHSKLCFQQGHLNAKQNTSFIATLYKNNFVQMYARIVLFLKDRYIIVCFLQLQTRINIKSDLMFGTILDSELTNLRELIWHGIKHGIGWLRILFVICSIMVCYSTPLFTLCH